MVANDINGDGNANDRAFIFDPARVTDTLFGRQLAQVMAGATSQSRTCLVSQVGRIAAANSCSTPWRAQLDLATTMSLPSSFRFGSRLRITANILNATAGIVRAFHLENTLFGRSTATAAVDQRLLYVTGFDSATKSFRYRVNESFGDPVEYGRGRAALAPTELQLGVEVKLGRLPAPAALIVGDAATDTVVRIGQIRAIILQSVGVEDCVDQILARRDTLGLTVDQLISIQSIGRECRSQTDAIMRPIVEYALRRGAKLTRDDLSQRLGDTRIVIQNAVNVSITKGISYLTSDQRDLLEELRKPRRP